MATALPAGSIDVPAAGSLVHRGPLIVGGWALGTSGPVTEVLVVVDGREATGASIGAERADVADLHPRVPNAERSGWEARIDLRGVRGPRATLVLLARTGRGQRALYGLKRRVPPRLRRHIRRGLQLVTGEKLFLPPPPTVHSA